MPGGATALRLLDEREEWARMVYACRLALYRHFELMIPFSSTVIILIIDRYRNASLAIDILSKLRVPFSLD
jgi:hypothetical protein